MSLRDATPRRWSDAMRRLENGERFPQVEAPRVHGGSMTLPADVEGVWTLVAFYRGHF